MRNSEESLNNPNRSQLVIKGRRLGKVAVSADEYERRQDEFHRAVDNRYNEIVSNITSEIQRNQTSDSGRIKKLFEYFTANDVSFDSSCYYYDQNHNLRSRAVAYNFEGFEDFSIDSSTKYPAVLKKTGVCQTFSRAFEDILNNWFKIPCRSVGYESHDNTVGHEWNMVLVDGEFKYVDIGRFLELRDSGARVARENYCLTSIGEQQKDDFKVEKEEMKKQYDELHPRITIKNYTGKNIIIKKRTDR